MDIDEVMKRIGEFGPSQSKTIYLIYLSQLISHGLHVLYFSFISADPGWSCVGKNGKDSCEMFENGECTPEYSTDFTSIVTEVGYCSM